jgi:VCBS repeat-containing protein
MNLPYGVAVSGSGEVYVADMGNDRVDRFSATGSFVRAFGKNVALAGSDTCTTSCQAGSEGGAAGQMNEPRGVAVSGSGDVYIADTANHRIDQYGVRNALPVANDDAASTDEDTGLSKNAAAGALANDTDADGDALTAVLHSGPSHGTLDLHSDGSYTYTPSANYSGEDSFKYKANDGSGDSTLAATVTITVNAVNDAPVVSTSTGDAAYTEGGASVVMDAAVTVADADDTNLDGARVRISSGLQADDELLFTAQNGIAGSYSLGVLTLSGSATVAQYQAALRSVKYRHTGDAPSPSKTVEFRVSDGDANSNTPIRAIAVTALDDPPSAVADSKTVAEDSGATTIDVLANDTDPDGGTKKIASKTNGTHGTVSITHSGSDLTYQPAAGYCGSDSFTYTLNGGSVGTVTITVTCTDTDGDGTGDNTDADDDNDGALDSKDAFPKNKNESVDTDGDGTGNNADADDDNDGVPDSKDAFPKNKNESVDTDGDGIGDNSDPRDDRPKPPVARTSLTISHRGRVPIKNASVRLRLRCTGAKGARCIGKLLLDPAHGKRRLKPAGARGRYGKAKFNIPAGKTRLIRVKATSTLLKALRGRRHVITLVTANYTGRNGAALKVERKLTLALPKR